QAQARPDFPGAATRLAQVSARHPLETVLAGLEQHLLECEAAGCLLVRALGDPCACCAEALDEVIADVLELSEIQQARLAAGPANILIEAAHGEGGHERVR